MKISKLKIIAKYLTGGLAGVAEYILDILNDLIQKLPAAEVAKYAQLAKDIANFTRNVTDAFITDAAKKDAAAKTAAAFDTLATALLDSTLTGDELDMIVAGVKAAIEAWKKA